MYCHFCFPEFRDNCHLKYRVTHISKFNWCKQAGTFKQATASLNSGTLHLKKHNACVPQHGLSFWLLHYQKTVIIVHDVHLKHRPSSFWLLHYQKTIIIVHDVHLKHQPSSFPSEVPSTTWGCY